MGHLLLAQEARWQLGLEEVLLMVTGRPPHKEIEDDPGADVRLEMARRTAEGEEGVEASDLEVSRDETSYSYRTLELLSEQEPGRELFFLLGADRAGRLASLKEPGWGLARGMGGVGSRAGGGIRSARPGIGVGGAGQPAADYQGP